MLSFGNVYSCPCKQVQTASLLNQIFATKLSYQYKQKLRFVKVYQIALQYILQQYYQALSSCMYA